MHKSYFDNHSWFLVPVRPGLVSTLRKVNTVAIWILAFVVLGVLVSSITPQPAPANAASHSAPARNGQTSVPVHHT